MNSHPLCCKRLHANCYAAPQLTRVALRVRVSRHSLAALAEGLVVDRRAGGLGRAGAAAAGVAAGALDAGLLGGAVHVRVTAVVHGLDWRRRESER